MGTVISPLPNIAIEFNGMKFDKKQIKISESRFFFDVHKTFVNIGLGGVNQHDHYLIKKDFKLNVGDEVLIYLNSNKNEIIIIDKVVSL